MDGITQGIGYTAALIIICIARELLGNGTFGGGILGPDGAGIRIIAEGYPALLLILPFGGFLALGCLIAAVQWAFNRSKAEKEEVAK